MTDVEKYGVFALVFVMGVLGLIVFYEPGTGQDVSAVGGQAVIIRSAADVPLTAGLTPNRRQDRGPAASQKQGRGKSQDPVADDWNTRRSPTTPAAERAAHYRVRSPADGAGAFDFTEPPLRYPGERTSVGRTGKDGTIVHVVRKGETLMDISKIYYGSASRWREIQKLNPKLQPTKMRPGDEIIVSRSSPAIKRSGIVKADSAQASESTPAARKTGSGEKVAHAATRPALRTYVVQKGDTLGQIAQRLLGTVKRLDELYAANKGVLNSPHDLKIGMELSIP